MLTLALLLSFATTAQALYYPASWYNYYAPGGWTYNAPVNPSYNCLAYALGFTSVWIWPDWAGTYVSEAEMDIEMVNWGKLRTTNAVEAQIVAYGYAGDIRHAAKVTTPTTRTIAKWGRIERFSHPWSPYRISPTEPLAYGGIRRYYW